MISWIQRSFQQHFKWLFLALLAIVIVSFVFITNASSGFGPTTKKLPPRPFFGLNLNSLEDGRTLTTDATLSAQLHGMQPQGMFIRDQGQLAQYAHLRHAGLHLANELNLPAPTEEELARHIQTLPIFSGPDGRFDPKRYAEFGDSLKRNVISSREQLTEADVLRVIADDVIYAKVLQLLSGPGYVLPSDVKAQLGRYEASWSIEAAVIDQASFNPVIAATDEELSKYFEYNAARYEIAAKAGVSYIDFPSAAYADKVTVTEEGLRAYYDANTARFTPPAADKPDQPANAAAAFAAARKAVEEAYRLERAKSLADRAAADFSVALFESKVASADAAEFAAARKLSVKTLAPFNSSDVPAELGTSPQVATAALRTTAERPYSDPINTGRGSAILVWNETIPARQPALAEVKERVKADYIEAEKRKRFAEAGRSLRTAIEARLKAGDTFTKAVAASESAIPAKVTTKTWPAFTFVNPPQDIDYSLFMALENLRKGDLSPMVSSADKGFIVYAADKQVPAIDETSERFVQMSQRLAVSTAMRNGSEQLTRLVNDELAKSEPADLR